MSHPKDVKCSLRHLNAVNIRVAMGGVLWAHEGAGHVFKPRAPLVVDACA